jgi:hypothetical protein
LASKSKVRIDFSRGNAAALIRRSEDREPVPLQNSLQQV